MMLHVLDAVVWILDALRFLGVAVVLIVLLNILVITAIAISQWWHMVMRKYSNREIMRDFERDIEDALFADPYFLRDDYSDSRNRIRLALEQDLQDQETLDRATEYRHGIR